MLIAEGVESWAERIVRLGLLMNEHQDEQEGVVCQRGTNLTRITIGSHQWPQTSYSGGEWYKQVQVSY